MAVTPDYRRVVIENCRPTVDGGRFSAKATEGIPLTAAAHIYSDSHDKLLAWIRWGKVETETKPDVLPTGWRETPLTPHGFDFWSQWMTPTKTGPMTFDIVGCIDIYGSLLRDMEAKLHAGDDFGVELEEAAQLVAKTAKLAGHSSNDQKALLSLAEGLGSSRAQSARVTLATRQSARELMERCADRSAGTVAGPFPLWVDRALAGFSSWYEMFPRSEGAQRDKSGTFATAGQRLPGIATMGFDVVYLPPIHPIGTTERKGANGSLVANPGDPGSPWAIGSLAGGHTDIHPDLGTMHDFTNFVATAKQNSLEVALDFAVQCSPDHPWVTQHPEWFHHRPDGSIRYAENPPKKYQDIYNLNFDTPDRRGLWHALRDVIFFWCRHDIRIFRVDNPHTKPLPFWEWLIAEVQKRHPDVIFLAEAFTKPIVMDRLAKVGFSQSYTYFTWRNSKWELEEYLAELSSSPKVDYFRPNFWTNTPDILHAILQTGGPPAFRLRLVIAAMCAPSWGMYAGYELFENLPLKPGSEEYLHSEKYEYKSRDWSRANSLAPLVAKVNSIRRDHRAAISQLSTLRIEYISNDEMLCVSRTTHDRSDALLVIVNLNPFHPQEGTTGLDLEALGIGSESFQAHDLLTDTTYDWEGPANYVCA